MSRSTFTSRRTPTEESSRQAAAEKHGLQVSRRRRSGLTDLDLVLMGKGPFAVLKRQIARGAR